MSRPKSVRFVGGLEELKKTPKERSSLLSFGRSTGQAKISDRSVNRKKDISVTSLPIRSKNVVRRRSSRIGTRPQSELRKVYLDQPEIIKSKTKKLLGELEGNNISLSETSIERIILGNPKEYLHVFKRIFQSYELSMKEHLELANTKWSFPDLLAKFDGRLAPGVNALYATLAQIFNFRPPMTTAQFMQHRFTIQKLNLCIDTIHKLSGQDFYEHDC